MRLFVAIELDDGARAAVAAEQRRVRNAVGEEGTLKWTAPDHMHVTVVFLGEVGEPLFPDVVAAVRTSIAIPPFRLAFAGLGVFPGRGAPRVIWLGATDGSGGAAAAVQHMMAARLRGVGIALESRPFRPHVTLARSRGARPRDARRVLAADDGREVATIEVDHVTLFESRPSPRGSTYVVVARGPFGAAAVPPVQ